MLPKRKYNKTCPILVDLIQGLYSSGLSTRQVSQETGVAKTWVFKLVRFIKREKTIAAQLRQPPISKHWRSSRAAARKRWERTNGQIPKGYHIHHVDWDFTNNRIENLTLLSASDHARHHHPANPIPRHLRPGRRAYMKSYQKAYCKKETARVG